MSTRRESDIYMVKGTLRECLNYDGSKGKI